jgi:cyclopropane-fatty-acyl-phospholipid synthase
MFNFLLGYTGWAVGILVVGWLLYTVITRLFARPMVNWYLNRNGVPLDKMIKVHNQGLWYQLFKNPSLALGEGYMFGWYTCDKLEAMITTLVVSPMFDERPRFQLSQFFNLQTISQSIQVAKTHYNIGNDLYDAMLGRTMQYSCAWWENVREGDLDAAQEKKMEMICKKLNLKPGMRVLDIGCGFGSLMQYLLKHHQVEVVGLNISTEQVKEARKRCPELDIRIQDYRIFFADKKNEGAFDRVVSVGMFEHVGPKNYPGFFKGIRKVLKPDGVCVLHTIGTYDSYDNRDDWIDKYIFPGGVLPSLALIGAATENVLVIENWINIGPYYATTLRNWRKRAIDFFAQSKAYDEVFQRMWYFYLTFSLVLFRERKTQLWQIVFTPNGHKGTYEHESELQIEEVLPTYGVQEQ